MIEESDYDMPAPVTDATDEYRRSSDKLGDGICRLRCGMKAGEGGTESAAACGGCRQVKGDKACCAQWAMKGTELSAAGWRM